MTASPVDDLQTLTVVLDRTAALIAGVRVEQWGGPTPCSDWDVQRLLRHLVGWADTFAARLEGGEPDPEPDTVELGEAPAGAFRSSADRLVRGMSTGAPLPENAAPADILVAEYVLHGWDLATATGQPVPYGDGEAAVGLAALREMLKPEYRGHGFDDEVTLPADAGALDRLVAFSGRDPHPAG